MSETTSPKKRDSQTTASSLELAHAAALVAEENRGKNIVVLDMRKLTAAFDYFVIVTGASRRQLHAISDEIDDKFEKELGDTRLGREGYDDSRWILLDYGDVVIHIFDESTRDYFSLEELWAEAPRVDLSKVLHDPAANEASRLEAESDERF
ncbi:ribosome silencing factor [Blastopirellula marina]|uniref:Ribosomal silencing factor RsfS n=1 Tax=Blastopirellula marina TaxID=124 RepID=A0A2S8GU50_9BACT|nr:ribosome silencing factor [Blastopirellula marina]PQO35140.1 ribosome silencing factor [Blastopirellula marina]PQO47930.1 ribosome silencing factor [Blastopirellula marina]PTL43889.1 ribosome silencing factor [Blastopirellula marina]